MNRCNQRTLNRVEQNDETLKELRIGVGGVENIEAGLYFSRDGNYDFSRLGASIGENTHLTSLKINIADVCTINKDFFRGLKQNSSIRDLQLVCQNHSIVGGVIHEILKAYQENNNLSSLGIVRADLQNGGGNIITTILTRFTNLTCISLMNNGIADQLLLQIVDAIRGHIISLEMLSLRENGIGNVGCGALSTLLQDPNCNLRTLDLSNNVITDNGAIALANSLSNNTKLKHLFLSHNQEISRSVKDIFSRALCNTSCINSIYSSNHTLENLSLHRSRGDKLRFLLQQNRGTNKSHVAIKKILKYHPNIDMEPFFEWNTEGEGGRDLKALPYVVAWFERAGEAVADDEEESVVVDVRKLSAIYQFAQEMPLLFVPVSQNIKNSKKRKRDVGL